MAQKRGLKKDGETGTEQPNPPKGGRPRAPRKVSFAIDLSSRQAAIERLADLYGVPVLNVIADLSDMYLDKAFAAHFAKIQDRYAVDRRQREEDALREIAPLVGAGEDPADSGVMPWQDMTSGREAEPPQLQHAEESE